MDDVDLEAFRTQWVAQRDGLTGLHYVEALTAAGQIAEALAICAEIWEERYVVGLTEAAWIQHEQGEYRAALELMTEVIPALDGDDQLSATGVVGCWRWHHFNDTDAEAQLRAGMRKYGSAWAALGNLLIATGRVDEGVAVLEKGHAEGVLECMLPLANILSEREECDRAEELYRHGYELGDAHSAWNLAIELAEHGRDEEADEWRWKAAQGGDEVAIRFFASEE